MTARGPRIVVVACLLAMAGCALTAPPPPDQVRSDALGADLIREQWSAATAAGGGPVADYWLATFDDPQLAQLVAAALERNQDLRAAAARVEQAAAYARSAEAALRPTLNLLGTGGLKFGGGADLSSGLQGAMLAASWEPDLWGRLRYGRSAAEDTYASARADYEFARQSLAAQVARSWFVATETRLQLEAARAMADSARELRGLAEERQRIGIGSTRDVALARAGESTLADGVRQAQLAHEQALRSLEVLVGRYPAAELEAADRLPDLPGPVPVGMPLDMLERRPDLIAAERRVAAAFNRVGEAKAARLPRIRLNASVATLSSDILQLKPDYDNPTGGLGGSLVAPLYLGGSLEAQLELRTAEQKEAVAGYGSLVLRALADVENALAASQILAERVELLGQVLADQERTLEYDRAAYRIGRQDLRSVEQQQQQVQNARMAYLRARSESLAQRVNLHLVLGGSFAEPIDLTQAARALPQP